MLKIEGLQAAYGHSQVLFDVSLEVNEGELVTLMGRNGMGKTTTIRTLMGLLAPKGGQVQIAGRDTTSYSPEKVARLGVGLVPEGRQIFPTLTVRENLVATASNRCKRQSPWDLAKIYALFPRMQERADQTAGTLSGGEQQMLAIGRALMTNPHLLILDEATEGLAPVIRTEIWHCIMQLREMGQSILLIDKNIAVLKKLADRHYIVEKGRTVWRGTSADLERDREQVHAYVGI
ncbi:MULTISPECIES: ABC transporter ATP-binding protein [Brucella/Ochrobactrum group]|uniref:ABC transporter related n=3 Tax=Brucella TaxID=234 RepID=A6X793_BRUA4|nr:MULTISPECIES: ABC transporter ATP-binding protein [Brucella/Ochrobactrum group]MCQ9145341.1 ABC transporter ATP-binding protein [Ochrobactrum sp. BTU2]QOD66264.1 ABC transporter ATP-binding protein [Ochrobactrum sp. MT180101]QTN04163.1 ATP-binding cassette domain-containing protein [Ochrobactrum sp. EEELCW01]RNL42739.1 ABC transporter ATP-binding protein [Ochrobactrum sp. MH181795]ABS17097.1 ABC transporter related [Brucella anthropi ATCC 49188]